MSLMTSLYTGISGMEASSVDLSVVGDNIANANTVGFKENRANFEDMLGQSLIGGNGQVGLGASTQNVQQLIKQGALTTTGNATDMALQGNGMFIVKGQQDGVTGTYYTRAGQFGVDNKGYLVNQGGLRVQGYTADATGTVGTAVGDLAVGNAASSPMPTSTLSMKGNLQSSAVIPAAFNPAQPAATSNFSSSTTVYDSLGATHQVDTYFRRTGAGTWEWHSLTDGGGVQGGTPGTAVEIAAGTLAYDTAGKLTAVTQASNFLPLGATQPQALTFNFGDPTGAAGTGLQGMTQFADASASTFNSQDGFSSGTLANLSVDSTGKVNGTFTNGQTRVLGQVAVANFEAPDRLERLGANLFGMTPSSGQPAVGTAGTGGRGAVAAGALEQSTVDLASQFVRMISAQRGYEANSKTISTADQLLQELIQIKR